MPNGRTSVKGLARTVRLVRGSLAARQLSRRTRLAPSSSSIWSRPIYQSEPSRCWVT